MTRPDGIISIEPKAVATYTAMCWIGDEKDPALVWMAERYGWKIDGMKASARGRCLIIVGKNNKRYRVSHGDYIIALGANGSLRVATVKEFDRDYREASA